MKKRLFSIFTATAMTLSAMPFVVSAENDTNTELWDKFLKYDLCITDFESLTDEEKELCHFIFDTEFNSFNDNKNEYIRCERARSILKHDDVGERVTVAELEDCYGIWDKYASTTGYMNYIHCVPDIVHRNFVTQSFYYEYWFDDNGEKFATFPFISFDDEETIKIYSNGKFEREIETKLNPYMSTKIVEDGSPYIDEYFFTEDTIEVNDDFFYITSDNTAVLYKNKYNDITCDKEIPDVIEETHSIPKEVNGYPVTAIEAYAFNRTPYKKIELPETLEYIGSEAFVFSSYLEEINFPNKLKYIGSSAFSFTKLKDLHIDCPDLIISFQAFADIWNSLKNIDVNAKEIESYAFQNVLSLEKVSLEKNVTKLGENVFDGDCDIYEIEISSALKAIGRGAFHSAYIPSVRMPSTVEILGAVDQSRPFIIKFNEEYQECVFRRECVIIGNSDSEAERYAVEWNLPFMKSEIEIPNKNPDINDNEIIKGDANCDGNVNMADAVMIMQSLANPDKYGVNGTDDTHITAQGEKNGDMDGNGLTNADALAIQKQLLKISVTDTGEQALFPVVKIHTANEMSQYEEMKKNKPVVIRNEYNPLLSSASGIGILFDFYYPNNSVNLSADKGTFKTWDIEKGSGAVESVGKTYTIENEGYIFWTPDKESIFGDEKIIIHITDSKNVNLGEIVITHDENGVFSAVLN